MSIASAPTPDAAELSVFVSHLVRRSQQRAVDLFAKAVGSDGLTHQQFILLLAVEQNPGTTQTRLVQVTGIDRSTLTDMIGRLGARGFLKRKTALHDKRANEVSITAKGRKALQSAMPAAVAADQAFIQELPSAKRSAFVDALKALSNTPEVEPEAPARPRARRRTVRAS
jgi:DNA-binding MarR family transcriptional regulator